MASMLPSLDQEAVWQITKHITTSPFFERTSKRRKGFPSETQVKRGLRIVHGDKELREKLGRNDPCPCGSMRKFKKCCMRTGCFRRIRPRLLFSASRKRAEETLLRAEGRGFSPGPSRSVSDAPLTAEPRFRNAS